VPPGATPDPAAKPHDREEPPQGREEPCAQPRGRQHPRLVPEARPDPDPEADLAAEAERPRASTAPPDTREVAPHRSGGADNKLISSPRKPVSSHGTFLIFCYFFILFIFVIFYYLLLLLLFFYVIIIKF
jgi:hypothetical protein